MPETTTPCTTLPDAPHIERIRHELKRRPLEVADVRRVTPGMLRVTLQGESLSDFVSLGFDDHVKLFIPAPSGEPERRDYTPRRFDARTLAIDFATHGNGQGEPGPATRWALAARPGDRIEVGGPRGSAVIHAEGGPRRWLLIGDETALPAIGRCIEEAEAGAAITSAVAVADPEEHQAFGTRAALTALWAHRPLEASHEAEALLALVRDVELQPGTFVWIAAEAGVARALRRHLVEERGHPLGWLKAAGYWARGEADAHRSLD